MTICEFCTQYLGDDQCRLGLKTARHMSCREFDPGIEKFCSNASDFVNSGQIIQMATYFGIKGQELKKVKLMAGQQDKIRMQAATYTGNVP